MEDKDVQGLEVGGLGGDNLKGSLLEPPLAGAEGVKEPAGLDLRCGMV